MQRLRPQGGLEISVTTCLCLGVSREAPRHHPGMIPNPVHIKSSLHIIWTSCYHHHLQQQHRAVTASSHAG